MHEIAQNVHEIVRITSKYVHDFVHGIVRENAKKGPPQIAYRIALVNRFWIFWYKIKSFQPVKSNGGL